MIDTLSRTTFSVLAGSRVLKRVAARYGMRRSTSFARRFVAGETLEEAVDAARSLEAQGLTVTVDRLGERVREREAALAAMRAYISVVKTMAAAGVSRNVSIKLTQIGLDIDQATCTDNLRRVLEIAGQAEFFVRIDMEGSAYTEATVEIFEKVWRLGSKHMGIVLQSSLRRTMDDVRRMNDLGARVRLVKGAYREPASVAYQRKEEVDEQFVALMRVLVDAGHFPAIATHDPTMIETTRRYVESRGKTRDSFEFQFLFGIRRDLQRALVEAGYPVRVYVPFGQEWFAYFMRRLGERPENVAFVLRNLWREEAS